jgi:Na+-driven multidrug efflux pump
LEERVHPAAHAPAQFAGALSAPGPRSPSPVAAAAAGALVSAPPEPPAAAILHALCRQLPWRDFVSSSVRLAVRCLLVLSTWTLASIAATRVGTYTMAAYQIMQQVLQLQLSVCWAFLAVGQSLVGVAIARGSAQSHTGASVHGGGADTRWSPAQRSARTVGSRVVWLAVATSCGMAALTWLLRAAVPRLFTADTRVLALVEGSALMMCAMLAISWNNAVEGVLLGAGDTQFVIDVYPVCVAGFTLVLALAVLAGWGLSGIWGALVLYYVGLVSTLSARFWMRRFRSRI